MPSVTYRRNGRDYCRRTDLLTGECECALFVPDLSQPLTPEQRQSIRALAEERQRTHDMDL